MTEKTVVTIAETFATYVSASKAETKNKKLKAESGTTLTAWMKDYLDTLQLTFKVDGKLDAASEAKRVTARAELRKQAGLPETDFPRKSVNGKQTLKDPRDNCFSVLMSSAISSLNPNKKQALSAKDRKAATEKAIAEGIANGIKAIKEKGETVQMLDAVEGCYAFCLQSLAEIKTHKRMATKDIVAMTNLLKTWKQAAEMKQGD